MKKLILAGALLAVAGCDSVGTSELDDLLVVEAFLFTDEPVTNIRITEAIPLSDSVEGDSVEVPVNDATVRLSRNGHAFDLVSTDDQGYYHYPGDDLVVGEGETFVLEVERGAHSVRAQTTVPTSPADVALSSSTIEIIRLILGPGGPRNPGGAAAVRESLQRASITVEWPNPSEELHFVVVESMVSGDPDFILPEFIRERIRQFRQVEEPTTESVFDVNLRLLEVFGTYRAIVYRVNQEYADLYGSLEQDSRDLNEPASNVDGGLGVFSAFAGVQETFEVVPVDG